MFIKKILANLHLFDGGTAAAGGASAGAAVSGAASESGEVKSAVPGHTRRGKSGEYADVKFGKQAQPAKTDDAAKIQDKSSDAGSDETKDAKASDTQKDRRKAFDALINGEYKDLFAERTQSVIDRRFRETKLLEQQSAKMQPIMDMLLQRYNVSDGDLAKLQKAIESDDSYWQAAADAAGMNLDQYKEFQRMKRENAAFTAERQRAQNAERINARIQGWMTEGEALKAKFPKFNFEKESEDPQFMTMLRAGVPVEHAYKLKHMDEIMADAMATAAANTEKRIVDNVRAKGTRPIENGTAAQSAFTVKDDVRKLSKKDRAEIARRVARGEHIEF